jgi:long-subunit acyl-CoA synthetase (AMP-forming)
VRPVVVARAGQALDRRELDAQVARVAGALRRADGRPRALALLADNGIDWVVADLAAERLRLPLVPLPGFFTLAQVQHALDSTGVDALLTDAPQIAGALGFAPGANLDGTALHHFRRKAAPVALPATTSKVTFTSGTTGAPKGVCLSAVQQHRVAASLVGATARLELDRHLALLPLSLLLENIAGVYAPRAAGATCCVPPLADAGVSGATGFDPLSALIAIDRHRASSVILLPQMLLALTAAIEAGAPRPSTLRFAAVGGGRIAPALIERARAAGLPAYEGYGLSESASVVALNVPDADRPGSVGRPLAHVGVRTEDGEIVIDRAGFLGYVGETDAPEALHTGDLGHIDADGFVHIDGRRKHQIITSFGRNVAPEWPEAELTAYPAVAQAAVFGEAQPQLCAVVVPRAPAVPDSLLDATVRAANSGLPDYARIAFWIRAEAPFSSANGLATDNGRLRRDAVWARYGTELARRYAAASNGATNAVL